MRNKELSKQEKKDYIKNLMIGGGVLGSAALGGWALSSSGRSKPSQRGGGGGRSRSSSASSPQSTGSQGMSSGSRLTEYEKFKQKEAQEALSKAEKEQQAQLAKIKNEKALQEQALEKSKIEAKNTELRKLDAIKEKQKAAQESFYSNLRQQQPANPKYFGSRDITSLEKKQGLIDKAMGKPVPQIGVVSYKNILKDIELPDGVNWNKTMTGFDTPVNSNEFLMMGDNARRLNLTTQLGKIIKENSSQVPFTRGQANGKNANKQYIDIEDANGKIVERRLTHKDDLILDPLANKQVKLIDKIKENALVNNQPMYVEFPDGKTGILSQPQMAGYLLPNNEKGYNHNINKNWLKTADGTLARNLINNEPTTLGRLQLAMNKVPVEQIANIPGKGGSLLAPFMKRNLLAKLITKAV